MPKRLSLPDYLPYQLSVASSHVSTLITRAYSDRFGLSIWEWRVVAVLGGSEPMTGQALVEATAMDKVTVSRAIRSLIEKAHVSRAKHDTDGRSSLVRLTEAGRAMFEDIAPAAIELEQALLDGFSDEDIARLKSVLAYLDKRALYLASPKA